MNLTGSLKTSFFPIYPVIVDDILARIPAGTVF